MRAVAKVLHFRRGYFKDSEEESEVIDVNALVNGGTLAIYMGVKRLENYRLDTTQYTDIDYPIAIVFKHLVLMNSSL